MPYKTQTSEIIKAKPKQKQFNVNAKQEKDSEVAACLGDFSLTELHACKGLNMREEPQCEQK